MLDLRKICWYINTIIMKYLTFILLFMLFSTPKLSEAKSCSIAPPENYIFCEFDIEGQCCIVEYEEDGLVSTKIVCNTWDECAWN